MDWIDLAEDRNSWMCLVNTVTSLCFHKILGNSWRVGQLVASEVVFGSTELVY
jgi:hypothetical protein